jgi:type II secretory ATPase GspE/PulE/Tfp pilus assembly ATPase PilB-like protein
MSDLSFASLALVPMNMESEKASTRPLQGKDAVAWPPAPFGEFAAETTPQEGLDCEVEGLNGRLMRVNLQRLDLDNGLIQIASSAMRAPMQLRFAQFRRVTLARVLSVLRPYSTDQVLNFHLQSRGAEDCSGLTVGHVKSDQGVFLFEPIDNSGALRRHLIPTTAYVSLSIGDVSLKGQLPPPARPAPSLSDFGPLDETDALPTLTASVPPIPTASPTPTPAAAPVTAVSPTSLKALSVPAPQNAALEVADFAAFKLDLAPKAPPSSAERVELSKAVQPPQLTLTTAFDLADKSDAAPDSPSTPTTTGSPSAKAATSKADLAAEIIGSAPVTNTAELIEALRRQARMPMMRMGEALLALGLIDQKRLDQALIIQRGDRSSPLGEILVRQGHIQRHDLQFALIRKMGYPLIDLDRFQPDADALLKVPYAIAARLQVLPLHLQAGRIFVAMEDPTRSKALDELEFATAMKVSPTLSKPGAITSALDTAYRRVSPAAPGLSGNDGDGADATDAAELLASLELEGAEGRTGDEDRPIEQSDNSLVRLLNQTILEAQSQGASDIHIETLPGKERLRIRFRRDGVLKPYMELPPTYRTALIARIKIMCDLDISEKRKPQDGKINFGKFHPGSRLELRVATIPTSNGLEDAVLRLLASAKPLPLDDVGLAPRPLKLLKSIVERPYGMFLCVGPTGSGKTTTLHSALGYINRPDRKIWTAEDPVEITQAGLRQVQVNPKIDWTFAKALRAFLRADPDVIMVGEIRDNETATVAVESSLTGHLVMSTLHTNSAPETVTRLLDMGMDPFNFADALLGVLAQRLVRRICGSCKTSREATASEIEELLADYLNVFGQDAARPAEDSVLADWRQRFGVDGKLMHHVGSGCDKCGGSGLRGRVGIHELMPVSRNVRQLIQTGARVDELQRQALAEGMLTLRQDGIEKVLQGFTTLGEVRASSN